MFQINGIKWDIKMVEPYHYMLRRPQGDYSVGCCNNDDKTIYLSRQLNGTFLKKVLAHELSHAALFSYSVVLPLSLEEQVADIIAIYGQEIISLTDFLYDDIEKDRYQFY